MDRTPYTDELIAIARAGIQCELVPADIFKIVATQARKADAEIAARLCAFEHLKDTGVLSPQTPPEIDNYKPHTPFIFNAVCDVWKKTIADPDFKI